MPTAPKIPSGVVWSPEERTWHESPKMKKVFVEDYRNIPLPKYLVQGKNGKRPWGGVFETNFIQSAIDEGMKETYRYGGKTRIVLQERKKE